MATLVITFAIVTAVTAGILIGIYLRICSAIRREDRTRGSLRSDASTHSAQAARSLVGISSSRWD